MEIDFYIGVFGLAVLLLLIFLGMQVGIAMTIVGFVGFGYLNDWESALSILGGYPYDYSASYTFSMIPLFILMGQFAFYSGLSEELYKAGQVCLGHLRGGLGQATILGCAGFSAITGSSLATSATMGIVALPEMRKYKYSDNLAIGTIASGGTLGILIPPSSGFVIYGLITEQSIGKLFVAGFLPGALLTSLFMLTVLLVTTFYPEQGPPGARTTLREKINAFSNTWGILTLFTVVIGGIYTGIFTPTESAGVGALGTFLIAYFRGQLGYKEIRSSLLDTIKTSSMIFMILVGAHIFNPFLAISSLPTELVEIVTNSNWSPHQVLFSVLFVLLILGCFLEGFAMLVLTVPVIFPVITALGFGPIWFGVILVIVLEMGLITPPVGMNVFVLKGVAPDISFKNAF
ncbi:MAG: TRAP transporter large permease, partial [Proteobacteria bacterium]|nr:TRAP transporter large permease [Pseudomonadota bacterium]